MKYDDSKPIQEVVYVGTIVAESHNSELSWDGTERNSDGTPERSKMPLKNR